MNTEVRVLLLEDNPADAELFPQEEILSGEGGAGLEETAQESDEVQTEVVKGEEGARKGIA